VKKKEKIRRTKKGGVWSLSVAAIADFVFKREGIATNFLSCLHIFPASISNIKSLQFKIQTSWPIKLILPHCR